jgi:uncharacterized protein (TIGR03084 family)
MSEIVHQARRASRLSTLREDLDDEQRELDEIVSAITDDEWLLATASPGWSVADQIGHLTYFDAAAVDAILDPELFATETVRLFEGSQHKGLDEYTLGHFRRLSPRALLNAWRVNRVRLADATTTLSDDDRVPWYGPSMSAASFISSRLMETWAHGTDIVDTLGVNRIASDRLRHVARIGFMTRGWSYVVRGEEPPEGEVRVELSGPSGDLWAWGEENAADTVTGSAEEFCLVVTQRRHVDDTSLLSGELGRHWLVRAQAFAGVASDGPQQRSV